MADPVLRFSVRVKPGSRSDGVGGAWGDDGALVVAVKARAVDGAANRAIVEVLAGALGLRRRQVSIVGGAKNRTKRIAVTDPPVGLADRVEALRGRPAAR